VLVLLWPTLGAMRLPVTVYALAIGAMMWRAAARARDDDPRALLGLAGAIVFALSDSLIALNKFRAPIEGVRVPILLTYWSAQTLVALSVPPRETEPGGSDRAA
jgi:alkenylglycerophosphocholine hydrolase